MASPAKETTWAEVRDFIAAHRSSLVVNGELSAFDHYLTRLNNRIVLSHVKGYLVSKKAKEAIRVLERAKQRNCPQ